MALAETSDELGTVRINKKKMPYASIRSLTHYRNEHFSCEKDRAQYVKISNQKLSNCYAVLYQYITRRLIMSFKIENGILIDYTEEYGVTEAVIPDSVTKIGEFAFNNCTGLSSITIPNSVTEIGTKAFRNCSNLNSINIPESVTEIGNNVFKLCKQLTSINVNSNNSKFCDINGVLFNKEKTLLIKYPERKTETSYSIPDSVTKIEERAFGHCHTLTSVTIPDSVTEIGCRTFIDCSSLISVTIPDFVKEIGDSAFKFCYSLTNVNISESVTKIGNCAFQFCGNLSSINVSTNNKKYCDIDGVLFNKDKTVIIKYPICKKNKSFSLPDYVTKVKCDAFSYCRYLTKITIPNSVARVELAAFEYCSDLISVNISSLEAWCKIDFGSEASNPLYYDHKLFLNGKEVTNLVVPDSVTKIGNFAFSGCSSLTKVTIPDSVTEIGICAFSNCSNLSSVTIPSSVKEIGDGAFYGCKDNYSISRTN